MRSLKRTPIYLSILIPHTLRIPYYFGIPEVFGGYFKITSKTVVFVYRMFYAINEDIPFRDMNEGDSREISILGAIRTENIKLKWHLLGSTVMLRQR